ncbi:VWD domain-containing protein [Leptolyngbya sp. AN02str]|uniref:VWD domain-containing protein n=1 Tax=Leptolyngbya sp. AN02str TaxID=3423363 RepID=UPI003D31554B
MRRLFYVALSVITCGLMLLGQLMGAERSLADDGYPPYLGDASIETLNNIRRTIEASRQAQAAIAYGSSVISATTSMDAGEAGAAIAVCAITPENCSLDPSLQAEAIEGISDIVQGRVGHHIDSRIIDGDPLFGSSPMNDQERDFWETMRDALENPEDFADLMRGSGASHGDPHIVTYDGLRYGFQTVGEFILTRSVDNLFEVQARQSRFPGRDLSLNTGVAIKVGGDRITFYTQNFPDGNTSTPLRVNGTPVTLTDDELRLPTGGNVRRISPTRYVVAGPGTEEVTVAIAPREEFPFLNVVVDVPKTTPDLALYTGIWGNFDGRAQDDLQTRNGRVIEPQSTYGDVSNVLSSVLPRSIPLREAETLYFEQMHREFGDSWRISQAESLFDYAPGQTTATFTLRGFPSSFLSLRSLTPTQLRGAEQVCRDQQVDPLFLEGCIFDVGVTQDSSFAQAVGNLVLNRVTDRVLDEVQDRIPVPIPGGRPRIRLPF